MVKGASDGAELLIPGAREDLIAQTIGLLSPMYSPINKAKPPGNAGQAIASHPAHGRRVRVHALAPPVFPWSGVGFEGEATRLGAQRLQAMEQRGIAHARQPLVDEHLGGGQDDAAVRVVLQLLGRLIADAHGPHTLEAGEIRGEAFLQRFGRDDAVDRPQRALRLDGDIGDVVNIFFHCLRGAEAVQGLDDEERVAQPAIAIVPGALGAWRFRDRGGVGGNDGAGLLEIAELERNRGANDIGLKFERHGKRSGPIQPILPGALEELLRCRVHGCLERLVGSQNEGDGFDEREGRLVGDV